MHLRIIVISKRQGNLFLPYERKEECRFYLPVPVKIYPSQL
jgi:hypothetical protein